MKMIVGLGNPGKEYALTRHNVGFIVLDALVRKLSLNESSFQANSKFNAQVLQANDLLFIKPQTFMNRSGEAVARALHFFKVALPDLYLIHDDLDLALGAYKIQLGKGPKVHNGIASVEKNLGETNFWRVRVGIDNRKQTVQERRSGEGYVLSPFLGEEMQIVDTVLDEITKELYGRII